MGISLPLSTAGSPLVYVQFLWSHESADISFASCGLQTYWVLQLKILKK